MFQIGTPVENLGHRYILNVYPKPNPPILPPSLPSSNIQLSTQYCHPVLSRHLQQRTWNGTFSSKSAPPSQSSILKGGFVADLSTSFPVSSLLQGTLSASWKKRPHPYTWLTLAKDSECKWQNTVLSPVFPPCLPATASFEKAVLKQGEVWSLGLEDSCPGGPPEPVALFARLETLYYWPEVVFSAAWPHPCWPGSLLMLLLPYPPIHATPTKLSNPIRFLHLHCCPLGQPNISQLASWNRALISSPCSHQSGDHKNFQMAP